MTPGAIPWPRNPPDAGGLKLTYHPGQRLIQATVEPRQYGFSTVSEGGLEPPRRCCITDSVMYHHFKLARRRRPARQFAMGASGSWRFSLPGPESWEAGRVYCAFMSLRSARMYG